MPLTDEQWAFIQPLLPPPLPAPRSRPPHDQRHILDAILWKIRTASPWYDLPPDFPSWQICYRRFHYWQRQGALSAIFAALDRHLRDSGGLDLRPALAAQHIRFVPLGGQTHIIFEPPLQDALQETWQLETVYLLLAVHFRVIKKKHPALHFRLAPPAPLAPPDPLAPLPTQPSQPDA